MPYQIKNGIIYSGNAVTLTQAQYDALTTAEKNNGTVYYIYDSDAMIEAQEVGLDGGNVETLAGSVATFETSPSTAVHAEGEYILYQAQLYKVTSAIAVGEDLTVGSNIEATNLGNELNNGLTSVGFSSPEIVTFPFTADKSGMLLVQADAISSSTGAYIYIKDQTLGSQLVTAYNLGGVPINQYYPCVKGHTYAVSYQSNVNNIVHRFFAMGN